MLFVENILTPFCTHSKILQRTEINVTDLFVCLIYMVQQSHVFIICLKYLCQWYFVFNFQMYLLHFKWIRNGLLTTYLYNNLTHFFTHSSHNFWINFETLCRRQLRFRQYWATIAENLDVTFRVSLHPPCWKFYSDFIFTSTRLVFIYFKILLQKR